MLALIYQHHGSVMEIMGISWRRSWRYGTSGPMKIMTKAGAKEDASEIP